MSELAIHTNVANRAKYACLVLKKAQRLGMKAAVLFDNEYDMDQMDNLLWTFEPSSFIPHAIAQTAGATDKAYLLSDNPELLGTGDILVLLTHDAPPFIKKLMERFPRVIDIVPKEEPGLTEGRRRFVFYKKSGITPTIHNRQ